MESYKDKVNKLKKLIKKLSDQYGGDDPEFLESYCQDVIKKYAGSLDEPIACFSDLTNTKEGVYVETK